MRHRSASHSLAWVLAVVLFVLSVVTASVSQWASLMLGISGCTLGIYLRHVTLSERRARLPR